MSNLNIVTVFFFSKNALEIKQDTKSVYQGIKRLNLE